MSRTWLALTVLGAAVVLLSSCDASPDGDADADISADAAPDVDVDAVSDTGASDTGESGGSGDADVTDADVPDAAPTPFFREDWPAPEGEWSQCDESEHITPGTLVERAAYYQWVVPRFHRLSGRTEDGRDVVQALFGRTTLDGPVPTEIVADDELPAVLDVGVNGNSGLWTSHYIASQAFRYAVAQREGDEAQRLDALHEVEVTLGATRDLMRVTGVPGLYARSYHVPEPVQDPHSPGPDNHFVEEGEFAGYSWAGDVSQDEYSGHMFALGVVARLVDDEGIQELCLQIASEVGHHLMDSGLHILDVDGEVTMHGRMNALSLTHFPGYNAWLSLNWIQMAGQITGDPELIAFYDDCLLQRSGRLECIPHPPEQPRVYTEYFDTLSVLQGCDTNFNSLSMAFLAAGNLVWYEGDSELRALYQRTMHDRLLVGDPGGRDPAEQANPVYNFIYAAFHDPDDPEVTSPAGLVHDAVCTLREFEPTGGHRATDTTYEPEVCTNEHHGSFAEEPFPWRERNSDIFKFWFGPYERRQTSDSPHIVDPPADFLLPYWMGRYFGFIPADL